MQSVLGGGGGGGQRTADGETAPNRVAGAGHLAVPVERAARKQGGRRASFLMIPRSFPMCAVISVAVPRSRLPGWAPGEMIVPQRRGPSRSDGYQGQPEPVETARQPGGGRGRKRAGKNLGFHAA